MDSEMMNVPGLRAEDREGTEMQGGKKYEELRAENAALREQLAQARKELKNFEALKKLTLLLVDGLERIPAFRSSPQERAAYQELFKIVQEIS